MAARNNIRYLRGSPYLFDELGGRFHRTAVGVLWRWRTELALTGIVAAALIRLAAWITLTWAVIVLAAIAAALIAVPRTRRFLGRRAWCVISRHRLQRVCYETRMHTRAGRLPFIVRIHPTKVGERAHILCRAGICADDFDAYKAEIAAACLAREARITRHKKWSQLVTVDIVRHDPLGTGRIIPSQIHGKTIILARPDTTDGEVA
jgi:hypothetical protein